MIKFHFILLNWKTVAFEISAEKNVEQSCTVWEQVLKSASTGLKRSLERDLNFCQNTELARVVIDKIMSVSKLHGHHSKRGIFESYDYMSSLEFRRFRLLSFSFTSNSFCTISGLCLNYELSYFLNTKLCHCANLTLTSKYSISFPF